MASYLTQVSSIVNRSPYIVQNRNEFKKFQFGNYSYNAPANANKFGLIVLDTFNLFRRNNIAKIISQASQNGKSIGRRPGAIIEEMKIPFQHIDKIPDFQKNANYQETSDIAGRFESIDIYSNSASQDISLELTYTAEGTQALQSQGLDIPKTTWTVEYIDVLIGRLKAFVYPTYNQRYYPPMRALLNIGAQYRHVPIYIKSVKIENMPPYDIQTGKSRNFKVILECRVNYPLWQSMDAGDVYTAINNERQSVFAYREFSKTQR